MNVFIGIIKKCLFALLKAPRKALNAARYLKETRDFKGLVRILKNKISKFIGPEILWSFRAFMAEFRKKCFKQKVRVHFLTFYTQGDPYDAGINLTNEVNELLRKTSPFVDSVCAISANQLKRNPNSAIYVKEFPEEAIWNYKTNKIGFLRWKPYILLKELEKMNDGEILVYRDCNITKYPNIIADVHNIRKNAVGALDYIKEDFFTPVELYPRLKIKNNVKVEVLKACSALTEKSLESYLHNASIIICRKTPKVEQLLQEWLQFCMDDKLISPEVNEIQHCDFLHNTQEQAIMNGILIKNGYTAHNKYDKPLGLSIVDRLFSLKKLVKEPRVAVLYCGQVRNFDNSELLYMNSNNILGRYNCDVFSSVWDERGYSYHHGESSPAIYSTNKDISSDNIIKLLSHSGCTVRDVEIESFDTWLSQQSEIVKKLYHEGLRFGNKTVKATSFPQLYKIYKANKLKCLFEEKHNFKYDLVIRMRPDMGFIEPLPDNFLYDELNLMNESSNIYHLNPPKIFYPNRIYDILFWGNSHNMDLLCNSWLNIQNLLDNKFDNGLPTVDCCRLLYVQAKENNLNVIDVPRCIGDIYRDEDMNAYRHKILYDFN